MTWGLGNLGGSAGSSNKTTVIITIPSGTASIVATASSTGRKKNAIYKSKDNTWVLYGLDNDTWTILATRNSGETSSLVKTYTRPIIDYLNMAYRIVPDFTYTGDYKLTDDDDQPISNLATYRGNFKIKFLTTGVFRITNMYGHNGKFDIFAVGGGGQGAKSSPWSGGGGGYTNTAKAVKINANTDINVTIGGNASPTSFGSMLTANGGRNAGGGGGAGGSGGGGGSSGRGGSDGSDGTGNKPGAGQHTTTREFGEPDGKLYAGGGGTPDGKAGAGGGGNLGGSHEQSSGATNTGGGGAGGANNGHGGSGIAIIRNAR